jgi:hypothetical protein
MYCSHISQDLARIKINDQIARAEAHRLAVAAKPARPSSRRQLTAITAAVRALFARPRARRPAASSAHAQP